MIFFSIFVRTGNVFRLSFFDNYRILVPSLKKEKKFDNLIDRTILE